MKATFFSSITNPATRFMYSAIYAGVPSPAASPPWGALSP